MIKGLDQLGVKSGIALGSLAKRLAETTDNAISLREAMEATAKASSSGMNSDQILRMGVVAKQASLALGVDMSDAISRLTRGITKLEPELLDELGIFIRIDDVVQAYAKSVGKSASAITDFERRMAFANATLDQGEKKFSAIDIESNPYSQLAAAVKTLTQSGLELLNTFLTPLIRLLSSSPTSLGIAIAGIATLMLKQAIPAIGQYREHLSSLAEESKNRVGRIYADQQKILAEGDSIAAERASIAFRASSKVAREVKDLQASAASFTNTAKTNWSELAAKNPFELTEKELKALDDRATRLSKSNKNESDALRGHLADMRRLRQKDNEAQDAAQTQFERKTSGIGSSAGQTEILANRALQSASVSNIRSLVSEKQAVYGAREAWSLLNLEIAKSKAGMQTVDILDAQGNVIEKKLVPATNALQNGWARVTGAVGIATGAISKFLDVASPWIMVIGVAIQAFSILDNALSGNKKQLTDFNSTLERSEGALDMLSKTLDDIANKPFGEQFNTQSLTAAANAIGEIGASVAKLIRDLERVEKASNGWDRFIDTIKSAWGGDVKSKFAESMSDTVVGALKEVSGSPEATAARKRLSELLSLDPDFTAKEFEKAIKSVSKNTPLLKQISDVVLGVGTSAGIAAEKSRALDASFSNSKNALKELQNQYKVSDTMSVFGQKLVADSVALTAAFEEPRQALASLAKLAKDTEQLSTFSSADRDLILSYADAIAAVNSKSDEQETKVKSINQELEKQNEIVREYKKLRNIAEDKPLLVNEATDQAVEAFDKQQRLREQLAKEQAQLDKTKLEVIDITSKFPQLAGNQLQLGADKINAGITAAFAKSAGILKQAAAGMLEGLPGIAEIQRDIANRQIDSQTNLLKSQLELIRVTKENSATIALATAKRDLEKAEEKQTRGEQGNDAVAISEGVSEAASAKKRIADQTAVLDIIKLDPKQAQAAIDAIVKGAKAGNKEMASQAESLMGYVSSIAGIGAQLADQAAQKQVNDIKARVGVLAEENKVKQDSLSRDIQSKDSGLEKLALQEKINGSLTEAQILDKQRLLDGKVDLETQKTIGDLETKQKSLREADAILGKDSIKSKERAAEIDKISEDIAAARAQAQAKYAANNLQAIDETAKLTEDQIAFENKLLSIRKSGTDALKDAEEQIAKTVADMNKSLEKFTPEYQAQQDAMLKATQIRNEAERKSQQITSEFIIKSLALQRKAKELEAKGATSETISKVTQELDDEAAAYGNKIIAVNKARDAELDALKKVEDTRKKASRFDDLLKGIVGLDSVWTNFGSSLAATAKAFDNLSKSQDQYTNTLDALYEKLGNTKDPEKQIEVFNEIKKTQKSQQISEVRGYAETAGQAKNMFKQKTAAYKTFAELEKALHVVSVAMSIQRIYQENAETIAAAAGSAKRVAIKVYEAGVSAVASVIEAIKGPFPMNVIAGAATAAVVYGLVKSIGGNAGSGVGGSGGAVENDGTGTVFGDSKAKSDTIAKSIEITQESDPVLMRNSSNMLKHLRSIDSNIAQFGVNLTRAINPGGYYNEQMGGINAKTGFKDYVLELIPGLNKVPGANLVNSLAKLIGTGVSTSVRGSGLQYGGETLGEANRTGLNANFFADVRKTYKAFGIKLGTDTDRKNLGMDADLQRSLDRTFQAIPGLIINASKSLGFDQQGVSSRLENYEIKAQTITFSGTDAEKRAQLEAAIGKEIDLIYKEAIPGMDAFVKANETYGTTVGRVAYGVDEASATLENLGINAIKYTDILNKQGDVGAEIVRQSIMGQETNAFIAEVIDTLDGTAQDIAEVYTSLDTMRDTVVDFGGSAQFLSQETFRAAGGLGELGDAIASFYDKFASDTLKASVSTGKVTDLFNQLGLTLPKTREEIFSLVNLLTTTDPQAAAKIMAATDALDDFYGSMEEFDSKVKSMQMRILELTGTAKEFLAAQRAQTLDEELDPYLKGLQNYIFALEDVKTAEDALTKARQAEANKLKEQQKVSEGFIGSIKRYIDSLRKFKDSLLLGAASPLTPAEKYREAKQQFDAILATAMGTAVTPAEQSAKEAALGQLEGASSSFLEASRVYNASSQQYTEDFNLVQTALTQTASSLATQLSVEEKSLAALNTQISALEKVDESVLSIADAVNNLAAAISAANIAAGQVPARIDPTAGTGGAQANVPQAIDAIYQKYTGRSADAAGKSYWASQVLGGSRTIGEVETEIQNIIRGVPDFVENLYQKYFGRGSDPAGKAYWVEGLMSGARDFAQTESEISRIADSIPTFVESLYKKYFNKVADAEGKNFWVNAIKSGASTFEGVETSFAEIARNLPAFAVGTNFVPDDMLAQVHRGERIIPAADNAQLMQSLNNRDEANRVLVSEIRNLRSEVKQLREQQAKETGNIIVANFDAQQRAAEQIEAAMSNTAQQSSWTAKVREGVKLK
jgi:hypothetical protein